MKERSCKTLQDCADDPVTESEAIMTALLYITGLDHCSGAAGEETVKFVAEDPIQKAAVSTSHADDTDSFAMVV